MECQELLRKEYTVYALTEGKRPASVKSFCDKAGVLEKDFYHLYSGFGDLEKDIFLSFLQEATDKLEQDEVFQQYGAQEKVLAILYTWFESLKMHRSMVHFLDKQQSWLMQGIKYLPFGNAAFKFLLRQALALAPSYLKFAEKHFQKFVKPILSLSIGEEIADRLWITSRYGDLLWGQFIILYRYWLNDKSPDFEHTDIAIEKTTRYVFDLIRPNALDSGFDLVRFLVKPK